MIWHGKRTSGVTVIYMNRYHKLSLMFLQGETPDPSDICLGEQISLGKYVWGHTFPGEHIAL